MELDELAAEVRAGRDDLLDRLLRAEEVAADLRLLGARLIGVFVDEARAGGHSWSDIGSHLGISRQAAQQRFTPLWSSLRLPDLASTGRLDRFTERARAVLAAADDEARRRHHETVEPAHVVLAILGAENLATRALRAAGVDTNRLAKAVGRLVPPARGSHDVDPSVGAALRRCFEEALGEALTLRHNYIGNEHLLLGMLHDAGVASAGLSLDDARTAMLAELGRPRE